MRLLVVVLFAVALFPGGANAATVDPKALVLSQTDVPARYLLDRNNSMVVSRALIARSPDPAARKLVHSGFVSAYFARYTNYGRPHWRHVTSGAYVFRGEAGAKRMLALTLVDARRGLAIAQRLRLGDDAWLISIGGREPTTSVLWRYRGVTAILTCSEMTQHRTLALALARKQQRRIAAVLR